MDDKAYESASKLAATPTWLTGAVLRGHQQPPSSSFVNPDADENRKWCGCVPGSQCVQCSFSHLQSHSATAGTAAGGGGVGGASAAVAAATGRGVSSTAQWLSSPMAIATKVHHASATNDLVGDDVPKDSIMALSKQQQPSHGSADINHSPVQGRGLLDLQSDTANSSDLVDGDVAEQDNHTAWQNARLKANISMHPLYNQLLDAHVACLRIATPVDQLPRIDAQIHEASHVLTKYSVFGQNHLPVGEEKEELDQFMTHYFLLLCTFKEQLQQHVRVHAMEAVMACWELEQSLLGLTGVSPGEGTGATMSDEDDDQVDSDPGIYDTGLDGPDSGGFGPLIPTETERSLMERVRQELKNELKTDYRDKIVDVREEILRKRRAGKLPGDTTSVLKSWWQAHAKWPYPTEDEKAKLVQETGLQLKQINNWFINQRKRNWHSNPSSSAALKTKRKR